MITRTHTHTHWTMYCNNVYVLDLHHYGFTHSVTSSIITTTTTAPNHESLTTTTINTTTTVSTVIPNHDLIDIFRETEDQRQTPTVTTTLNVLYTIMIFINEPEILDHHVHFSTNNVSEYFHGYPCSE